MLTNKIGLISDDFTGANDSGVQLALKGLQAAVILDHCNESKFQDRDVFIIDTDSRSLDSLAAKKIVKSAAALLQKLGYNHLYKKVDSTLRGNIGAEISGVEEVYRPELVVIAPALPKMGRTTKNGYHYVHGTLISETEFGKDPKTPVLESYIPSLLLNQSGKKAAVLTKELICGSEAVFFQHVDDCLIEGTSWIVCDIEAEADFELIVERFLKTKKSIVWAGSAGLIEYLPERLQLKRSKSPFQKPAIDQTLTVSGSLSQTTKLQLQEAGKLKGAFTIKLDVRELLLPNFTSKQLLETIAAEPHVRHYIMYVESSEENRLAAQKEGERLGLDRVKVSERIAQSLGILAKDICEKIPSINSLILTGGDTAKAVCSKLGVTEVELVAEIEPGLPFGKLLGNEKELWAVTKAGGFGHQNSLENALDYLTRRGQTNANI